MLQVTDVECGFCDAVYAFKGDNHDTLACAADHGFEYTPKFSARLTAMGLDSVVVASIINLRAAWDERARPSPAAGGPAEMTRG